MRKFHTTFILLLVTFVPLNSGFGTYFKKRRNSETNLKDLLGEAISSGNVTKFEELQKNKEFLELHVYCVEKIVMYIDRKSVELMESLVRHVGSVSALDAEIKQDMRPDLERITSMNNNFWLQQWLLDQNLKKLKKVESDLNYLESVQGDSIVRFYSFDSANNSPSIYPINETPSESTS